MKKPTKTKAVITSGLIPKRGRAWAYGYADLATLFKTSQGAMRQLVYSGRLAPDDLINIIGLYIQWFPEAVLQLVPETVVKDYASAIPDDYSDACPPEELDPKWTEFKSSSAKIVDPDFVPKPTDCSCPLPFKADPHCSAHGHRAMWKTTGYVESGPTQIAPGTWPPHDVVCVVCVGGFTCYTCSKWNDTETSCPCQKCQNCEGEGCDVCLDQPSPVVGCIGCTDVECVWCPASGENEYECVDCGTSFTGNVPLNLKPLCETCLDKPHVVKWKTNCIICHKPLSENCEHVYADKLYNAYANMPFTNPLLGIPPAHLFGPINTLHMPSCQCAACSNET